MQVAHDLVGNANVLAQDLLQRCVHRATLHDLHRRDLQALLEYFACVRRADATANIRRVRDRPGECDKSSIEIDRLCDGDVREMPGPEPAVIGDEDVALAQGFWWKDLKKAADGAR